MATMFGMYPFLMKLYADGGYQGPLFRRAVAKIMARVNVEIVKRSDHAKGFVVLPKRWVVERTFAWLGRCRRLAKDWENLNRKALAFLRLASIRIMLRKLCNPTADLIAPFIYSPRQIAGISVRWFNLLVEFLTAALVEFDRLLTGGQYFVLCQRANNWVAYVDRCNEGQTLEIVWDRVPTNLETCAAERALLPEWYWIFQSTFF